MNDLFLFNILLLEEIDSSRITFISHNRSRLRRIRKPLNSTHLKTSLLNLHKLLVGDRGDAIATVSQPRKTFWQTQNSLNSISSEIPFANRPDSISNHLSIQEKLVASNHRLEMDKGVSQDQDIENYNSFEKFLTIPRKVATGDFEQRMNQRKAVS